MQTALTWLKHTTQLIAAGVMFFCCSLYAQVVVSDSCDIAISQAKLAGWSDSRISDKMRFEVTKSKAAELGNLKDGYGVMSKEKFRDPLGYSAIDTGFYLCTTKNELAARANGPSTSSNTASSSASQPPQTATQPNVANNQTSPPSSGNITAECDQEQSRIISKATADAKALVATGDLAGMQRIQLVRNIAMRDLYSGGRCSGANNATARREQAQQFINMDQRFCQQWGMGSQCAAPPVLAAAKPSNTTQSNSQRQQSNGSSTNSQDQQSTSSSSSTSAQSQSSGRRSVAGAQQCISVNRAADRWAIMKNNCPYDIEAAWCYAGGDCKNGTWGTSSLGTVRAGDTRSASTFTSKSSQLDLHVIACKGANTSPQDVDESHYQCFE